MNKLFNHKKIGILGGGQLGRMLLQKAMDFALEVYVLDPDKSAPCKSITSNIVNGDFKNYEDVYHFGKKLDLITIEIENVNVEALKKLQQEGKEVYPQPEIIEMIQDKGLQKIFYQTHGIPTADFFLVENKQQIEKYLDYLPFFQKTRKGGYDGKGVRKIVAKQHLSNAFDEPCVLERMVDVAKEISVIVARNVAGEIQTFPLVESVFNPQAHLVDFLICPASVSKKIQEEAENLARKIAEQLNLVGLLAIEYFLTKDGKLLVNEMAPRVHNSGHHTIEACVTSQFEQHWRSILNLPLGDTSLVRPAVMVNLLGSEGFEGEAHYVGIEQILKYSGVYPHLYGKKKVKAYRKMGHITVTDKTLSSAMQKARKIKELIKVTAL
ncbi:MAG: N5-carboxyaminoimidazole ribonucleotide synthase [Bacteroidia bacterium]|nr:MAG: N5-carboxyaminoimidazole ribonucleotide synthase [Bacteroidia bacterium]